MPTTADESESLTKQAWPWEEVLQVKIPNQNLKCKRHATVIDGTKFFTKPKTAQALRVTLQTIRA